MGIAAKLSLQTPNLPYTAWARFFIPSGWTNRLAVMRILCVGSWLLFLAPTLEDQRLLLAGPGFEKPQALIAALAWVFGEEALRQPGVLGGWVYATVVIGGLAFIGLWTRVVLPVFTLGVLVQMGHVYSYDAFQHTTTMFALFLVLLSFSPCGDCLSVDAWRRMRGGGGPWWQGTQTRLAGWPIVTIHSLLALAYMDAAVSKIVIGGSSWFNGYTMQHHLLNDAVRSDLSVGLWLARSREWCIVLGLGAVVFELCFWMVLVPRFRRLVPWFIAAGLMMHLGIYVLQKASFFSWMLLYLTWVPWERLVGRLPTADLRGGVKP